MAGTHSSGEPSRTALPLSYRLSMARSRFRYSGLGRAIRAHRHDGALGLLFAAGAAAFGFLPLMLAPPARLTEMSPSLLHLAIVAGLVGGLLVAVDLFLAWLTDPDWMKLHGLTAAFPLVLGLSLQVGAHSVPLVFGDAERGLLQVVLAVSVSLVSLVAGLTFAVFALDELEGVLVRRQAQRRVFNPFDGTLCRDLSDGE